MKSFAGGCSVLFFFLSALGLSGALTPDELRVDNWSAPLGIDSPAPAFSWKLRAGSADRGAASQTAWQIRAGTAPGKADAWDSGQVVSADQLNVRYAGRPLRSHETLFWQVRVWDARDQPSAWSPSAPFTMGVLTAADWAPARWITDPALLAWQRTKLGYSSPAAADAREGKWVQFDLRSAQKIDRVRLYPIRHTVPENLGFPSRFKLEASDDPGFAAPRLVADYTEKNYAFYPAYAIDLPADLTARYLRFTFPRKGRVAFAQAEVLAGGRNLARSATVTASDSQEDEQWGVAAAIDGLAVPGGNPRANSTLRLRREFSVRPGLQRALLHVSGLGQYSLRLNGVAPGTGLLTPGWTTYEKTILYDSYDVTAQLRSGANAVGLELAGGMFNVQPGRYVKFVSAFRPLTAIAQLRLEYADGSSETVATDASWRVTPGPVTFSNVFGGEDYDARLEPKGWDRAGFDDRAWSPAVTHAGLGGELKGISHASPPFRTFEVLKPVASHELRPGVTVYDLGQNASLTLHVRVKGAASAKVKILPSELLYADGTLNRSTVGNAEASWNYTLAGGGIEDWRPPYFYHGSRYLQVELSPAAAGGALPELELIEGLVTHSDSAPAGDFACSSDLFNRIRLLIRWAQRSNLAHVISDCPHRERLGWLEQYHLNGPALRYEWDLTQLYSKCFDDMADAQTADGLIPDIAPEFVKFNGGFRDSPEWGSAFILAAWQHFVWTADDAPLRRHFPAMQRYFDYLTTKSKDHILNHGLGDWYDRGPKEPGVSQLTPIALTATAIYYEDALALARIAKYLGREDAARDFTHRAAEIKTAFNRAFLDPATGIYAKGSQTAQALPLVLDLVPAELRPKALAALIHDIESRGHAVTAGDVGYRYLLRALADGGRSDVIYTMINQSDKPGYGYQLAHGATSLTEAWDANPRSSQNHFMLGQIMEWFHGDLAGLAPDPTAPGFAGVIVKPQPLPGIDWAKANHESPRGTIAVEWKKAGSKFTLQVNLPPNTTARVRLPGTAPEAIAGAKIIERDPVSTLLEVPAGHHEFTSTLP